MNVPQLKSHIKNKDLPKMLVFVGNEYAIINEYIDQICKVLKLEKYSVASACSVLTPNKVMTLTQKNRLYVSKYEKQIQTSEKNWEYVKNLGNNYLIVVLTQIDKRGKFYKHFEENVIEFDTLNADAIYLATQKKVGLKKDLLYRLIQSCDNNYGRVLLEIQKIKAYSEELHCSEQESYEKLLSLGVIYEEPTSKIQEFTKCVLFGDYKCFSILEQLKRNNESAFVLLAWLYNNIRNQLIVQTMKNVSPQATGINYYAIKECLERKGYYSIKELISALQVLKRVEQGLKNGLYEEDWAIDYALINIL